MAAQSGGCLHTAQSVPGPSLSSHSPFQVRIASVLRVRRARWVLWRAPAAHRCKLTWLDVELVHSCGGDDRVVTGDDIIM